MDNKTQKLVSKIEAIGYKAIDVSNYNDPNSLIKVQCENGHDIQTS